MHFYLKICILYYIIMRMLHLGLNKQKKMDGLMDGCFYTTFYLVINTSNHFI